MGSLKVISNYHLVELTLENKSTESYVNTQHVLYVSYVSPYQNKNKLLFIELNTFQY